MFRKISSRIARQFTAFVFVLFLVNGVFFLAADFGNARRQAGFRLEETSRHVMDRTLVGLTGIEVVVPSPMRDRVRIVDMEGNVIFGGGLFEHVPFDRRTGFRHLRLDGEEYDMLTSLIERDGVILGYLQVAELDRLRLGDIPRRAVMYLLVSFVVTALTYAFGVYFARRNLQPAVEMMERLEQFTQDASHELRTPIAALSSSLDLALKSEKYREGILSAKDDLKQISALVERLLELARLDRLVIRADPVDLSSLVVQAADRQRPLAEQKNVEIRTAVADGVSVRGDGALLQQVVNNLLTNAIKFSKPDGGTVTVTLTRDALTVADTGIGIDAPALPHIFDRFYQAEASRARGGYGLGLSLVKRIVELHGWSVRARSEAGQGTAFTVDFKKTASSSR